MTRKGHERRQANQNSEINRRGIRMLSLRNYVGPKIRKVNFKRSIKVSSDFFASATGKMLIFATSKKNKGEEGKEEDLDFTKADWGRVIIITRIMCFSDTRSQGHQRLGQTHRRGAKVKSSQARG